MWWIKQGKNQGGGINQDHGVCFLLPMNQRDQSTVVFPTRVGVNREAISAGRIVAEYSRRKGEYVCHMTVRDKLGQRQVT